MALDSNQALDTKECPLLSDTSDSDSSDSELSEGVDFEVDLPPGIFIVMIQSFRAIPKQLYSSNQLITHLYF